MRPQPSSGADDTASAQASSIDHRVKKLSIAYSADGYASIVEFVDTKPRIHIILTRAQTFQIAVVTQISGRSFLIGNYVADNGLVAAIPLATP